MICCITFPHLVQRLLRIGESRARRDFIVQHGFKILERRSPRPLNGSDLCSSGNSAFDHERLVLGADFSSAMNESIFLADRAHVRLGDEGGTQPASFDHEILFIQSA